MVNLRANRHSAPMAKPKKQYWLMKSEPEEYSIDDLKKDKTEPWEGIRNYQARNFMRDMNVGDLALFYHSNAKPPGVAGVCKICKTAYPDPTQFDKQSKYFDAKSKKEDPHWSRVDVEFVEKFDELLPLQTLKDEPAFSKMRVVQKGSRLSVQPVEKNDFGKVLKACGAKTKA